MQKSKVKIKLRKIKLTDLDRVIEIEKVSFPEPWPRSYFERVCRQYPDGFIVAEIDDKIIGYTIGQLKKEVAKILSLAVDPVWRRKGIGTKLTEFLISHFKDKGVGEISLHVRVGNRSGVAFYKKLDFKVIKTIEKYYSNGDDAYLMKKEI